MPALDPNWFYSSLAQSAAAIVGLLGGIFAARLQDQITAAREQRVKAISALNSLHSRGLPLVQPMSDFLQHTAEQLMVLKRELSRGTSSTYPRPWYSHTELSPHTSVEVSERMIQVEIDRAADVKIILPLLRRVLDENSVTAIYALERGLTDSNCHISLQTAEQANNLRGAAQYATRELKILELRSRTQPSWMLWACLVALSIFGVALPLCFLSAYLVWHKFLLLGAFTLTLAIFLVYLAFQIKQLADSAQWKSVLPPDDSEFES